MYWVPDEDHAPFGHIEVDAAKVFEAVVLAMAAEQAEELVRFQEDAAAAPDFKLVSSELTAGALGVDAGRLAIAGVSAGGGLAAATAIVARDRGGPRLKAQMLICPMLDDRQQTPSIRADGLYVWSKGSNEFGWRSYLGDLYGKPEVPAYAAPARAADLRGLPPAYICVGNVDGFRDDATGYATRLNQAGVSAELHVYAGAPHGVKQFADVPVARRYIEGISEWIGAQLQDPGPTG